MSATRTSDDSATRESGGAGALERFEVQGDGVVLHVSAAGPVDAPVVVLVHGYPDTSRVWYPVMDELADRYRVVAYDVRGMGGSGAPTERRGGWRLERLTADFAAVVDAVSPDRQAVPKLLGRGKCQGAIGPREADRTAELPPCQ